jgi:hypothetical protein
MLYAICYMLYAICYMLYAICYMLYAICYMLYQWHAMLGMDSGEVCMIFAGYERQMREFMESNIAQHSTAEQRSDAMLCYAIGEQRGAVPPDRQPVHLRGLHAGRARADCAGAPRATSLARRVPLHAYTPCVPAWPVPRGCACSSGAAP